MNKNLKKVISTVAALALSASAVSAFAVNFPDVAEDASYAQAVQELSALGVVSGFEDGTFRPDELVTRAQMSKFIVDALAETEQAEASKAVTQFADVAEDHWAKGYINQGVADTFISGYGDGNFGPDDNVTYAQAQSMLVRAIGYQTYAEGSGGWPNGYKTWAASQGITKGIYGLSDDTQLTRAQVAQLVDNTMGAPVCVIKDYETTIDGRRVPNLEIKDDEGKDYQTLFTKKHDAYKVFGRVKNTNKTDSSVATDQVVFTVEKADNFDDEYYKGTDADAYEDINAYFGDTNAPNMLRTYAEALIQKDTNDEWNIISIVAAASNKSVTLAAEDFDENKSVDNKLYFFPEGTTKNSTKYELADDIAVYVNGKEADNVTFVDKHDNKWEKVDLSKNSDALIAYIDTFETSAVTLQKETKKGTTSTESKYNLVQISTYATAIVSDVIVKSDQITVNFDDHSDGIKGQMKLNLDDDNYTYDFTLDGEKIDPADLQEDDVLSIAYDTEDFAGSSFYDVLVSRDTAEGKCTTVNSDGDEWTIGGTKYKAAEGMTIKVETSAEYTLYLDHFGRIAKADEESVNKKFGILKNVYKKAGGDYYAQVITKEGVEEEYKIDNSNIEAYQKLLVSNVATWDEDGNPETYKPTIGEADYSALDKVVAYPQQVIEYSVASSTNKLTVKKDGKALTPDYKVTKEEYKESGTKIGSLKMADSTVILDISDADDDDDIKVISTANLTDGNDYSAVGFDKTDSGDRYCRYVLVTDGTSNFNSESPLAIFNGQEQVDIDGDDRIAFNLIVNGKETQYVLKDTIEGDWDGKFYEGDALFFVTNAADEITDIEPVFSAQNMLNGKTWTQFTTLANADLSKVIVNNTDGNYWKGLLSDGKNDDMNLYFGVVVNKQGSNITLAKQLVQADGTTVGGDYACYDQDSAKKISVDLTASGANVYAYDFAASSKNSRVFTDNGLQATPDYKSQKITGKNGQDLLDITHVDIENDVVYAVVRVDDDEVKDIYLIINED